MKITFYYIEGISDVNTPSFFSTTYESGSDDRLKVFKEYKVFELDSNTFYPPHYRNTIKISIDDLPLNKSYNYLSLYYNGKYYYYFVEDIEYINESIYAIYIRMDTIVTFAKDIQTNYGIVERMHINRWKDDNGTWKINRNYIRENFSKEDYVIMYDKSFTKTNDFGNAPVNDNLEGMILVLASEVYHWGGSGVGDSWTVYKDGFSCIYDTTGYAYDTPITYCFIPLKFAEYQIKYTNTTTSTSITKNTTDMIKWGTSSGKAYQAMFIPFNIFPGSLKVDLSGSLVEVKYEDDYFGYDTSIDGATYFYCKAHNDKFITAKTLTYSYNFSFIRNANLEYSVIDNPVNLEPSLLDENYINTTFGEKSCYSICPLYLVNTNTIVLNYTADIGSGNRIYWFTGSNTVTIDGNIPDDALQSKVMTNSPLYVDMLSDAYNEWYVSNRATIGLGLFKTGMDMTLSIASGALGGIGTALASGNVAGSILSNPASYTKSRGLLSAQARKALTKLGPQPDDISFKEIGSKALNGLELLTTVSNKKLEGDYINSNGNYIGNFISDYCFPHLKIQVVKDIERVANMYRLFGNKVYSTIESKASLSSLCETRYYYNFIKMEYIDVHLKNYINSDDIIADIIKRFTDGIRFWHYDISGDTGIIRMEDGLDHYYYDNVEVAFL